MYMFLMDPASRWNAPDPVLYNASPYLGTMHGSDTYFLFDGEFSKLYNKSQSNY